MAETEPAVLYEKHGMVAEVVLNRPRFLNAYNVAMRDGLYEVLTAIRDDPEVAVVVIFGNGRAFCTGGDLREFGGAPSPSEARAIRWSRDVWGTLWNLPQLTIAGVHGPVTGGGFEMTLLCDQCVAARDARFALPETGLAMIPGVAGTQTLPRLTGLSTALALTLCGDAIDAARARELGLAQHVVAPAALRERTRRLARKLAGIPPELRRPLKRLVSTSLDYPLEAGLAIERRTALAAA